MLLTWLESSCERRVRRNSGLMTYLLQFERGRPFAPKLIVHLLRKRFSTKASVSSFMLRSVRILVFDYK